MNTKRSLLTSCLALFLCFAMLLGTTFAWFTDTVTSSGNKIKSGSLKLDLKVLTEVINEDGTTENEWVSIKNEQSPLFTYENWEPGYTDVTILKVENLGTLALKWEARFASEQPLSALAEVIDVYVKPGVEEYPDERADLKNEGWNNVGNLKQFVNTISETTYGYLDGKNSGGTTSATLGIALKMREDAGNEYQDLTLGEFDIRIVATQAMKEEDSFGDDYDENAQWPQFSGSADASAPVKTDSTGKVTEEVTFSNESGSVSVTVPEGVMLTPGTNSADLTVTEKEESDANILSSVPGEETVPFDVHIEGVAEGNTTPIAVSIKALLPRGLNGGNYGLVHVQDDGTHPMTLLADGEAPAHNTYTYDPATGDVTLYMASFSEVAVTAYSDNKWNGNYDFSWYPNAVSYKIANADQLAAFGAIVGGMVKKAKVDEKTVYYVNNTYKGTTPADGTVVQDSFEGKTITLIADINIGDTYEFWNTDPSENGIVFYPIGYWNNEGTYERKPVEERTTAVQSGFYAFQGTFDGNGHTISNFYQNTWEMKGDHNWYNAITEQYYRDGMGLFGKVYDGTVKNLTVDNFSSDGEITTTGVIAAYADCGAVFENIAITNCNPRVYNIGNGGIVGCVGWYANEVVEKPVLFKNITVDNTNKISALWGSWDVACGGIVGQYYPTSGQTTDDGKSIANRGMNFIDCHSSAIIDVYNDVCANYQYYAYRYSGLLIGSVRENETIDGHVYPKMNGITAENCTVHFGDWNDYYYCEIVANSLASYTYDHQMSRLTQIADINVEKGTYLPLNSAEWKEIPTSGWVHYVKVKGKNDDGTWKHGDGHEFAECYHFVNGAQHFHDVKDDYNTDIYENKDVNGDGVINDKDLKEDKQLIYREFKNLVTGYGWGVTSKGVGELAGVTNLDIEAAKTEGDSYVKFDAVTPTVTSLFSNHMYKISDFFTIKSECGVDIPKVNLGTVTVSALNLDTMDQVIVNMHRGSTWDDTYIEFLNAGTDIALTIQDYYYCTPTSTANKYTLQINSQFLLHNETFPLGDDFSEEWIDENSSDSSKISNFKTSGDTTYYYVDRYQGGTNSRFANYFYFETDITIHEIVNDAQWPKIGIISGNHYKDVGQTKPQYRMTTFYLAVNRSSGGVANSNSTWNEFGVTEVYNQYDWGWNVANDTIYSDANVYELSEEDMITFGDTFKLGLLRDGLDYHFFVNGNYAYTYQINEYSELYAGRNEASDIGFFHFDTKATYSNYKVIRSGSSLIDTDGTPKVNGVPKVPAALNTITYDTDADDGNKTLDLNPDWCYHNFIKYEAKEPTCGEDGNIAYNYCVKCKLNYPIGTTEEGNAKVSSLKSDAFDDTVVIKATENHNWSGNVCTNCGMYQITVNHHNLALDGKTTTETVALEAVDGIVTYTVDKASHAGVLPSHDYVKVNVADNSYVDVIDIYYSEVDVWGGSVSESLSGSGETADDPYLIQSAADLAYIASVVNALGSKEVAFSGKYFKLTKSIDLNSKELMIGTDSTFDGRRSFGGYLDGNNCAIRGISNTKSLFGCVEGGYIKNLSFYGTIKNTETTTGVIGYLYNANLKNITNYATVTGVGNTGGIVGNMQQSANRTSTNLVNYGTVAGHNYVGGIAGLLGGEITNSVNWGTVKGNANGVGGIIGSIQWTGTVGNCYNYGDVKGTTNIGGIAGNMREKYTSGSNTVYVTASISGSVNYGNVTGTGVVGDISGHSSITVSNCISDCTITVNKNGDCEHLWSEAPVAANGIVVFNCANCTSAKLLHVTSAWDGTSVSTSLQGSGTEADPYLISSGADLAYINSKMGDGANYTTNGYFKLTTNIDLGGNSLIIGEYPNYSGANMFNGTFDGNGYCIVNLNNVGSAGQMGVALFSMVTGTVKNLTVHGAVSGNGNMIGGIVGYLYQHGGSNFVGTMENCVSYVNVISNTDEVGGIVGTSQRGTITNCVNYGTVVGNDSVGGIAGKASGTITDCTNYGIVAASGTNDNTSGIYGSNHSSVTPTVTNCKNNYTAAWDGVTATEPAGSGTEADPYLISSGANLAWINSRMTAGNGVDTVGASCTGEYFKMTGNIDLGGHQLMIGDFTGFYTAKAFNGTFDGNGYCIVNLNNTGADGQKGVALFSMVIGTVKNLTVHGTVTGNGGVMIGGIVGYLYRHVSSNYAGTMENCVSCVNVTSTAGETGGMVGTSERGIITNCVNYGSVTGTSGVGGVTGTASGTITDCANYGTLDGTYSDAIYGAKRSGDQTLTVDGVTIE